jgi:ATP-dependent helicase/nuclease subunit B
VGLESTEVGVLPPSADGVAMGTMIRTRPRPAKAVIVIAANEGILPMQVSTEGLFSIDEKNYFVSEGFALGGLDDNKMLEENVAMYRMMALPLEKLYVSYSMSDTEGKEKIPSLLVDALHGLFPRLSEDSDIVSNGWGIDLVNGSNETLRHLINHIKTNNESGEVDSLADALVEWFEKNEPEKFDQMRKLSLEENDIKPIGKELAKALYARSNGEYVFSASQFDTYYMCPYSYFIGRGLAPREERLFESDPRSIGDIYHNCLMEVGQRLKRQVSDWKEVSELSDEDLKSLIHDIIQELAVNSEGGLFLSTGVEQYRVQRIEDICFGAARAMLIQLGTGSLEEVCFEEAFGRGKRFEPISMNIAGQDVYIEGRIDRVDLFKGNRVRVIDYKTGTKSVNRDEIEQGYNMQLMIYMLTATGDKEPAGLFYFNIKDPMAKVDAIPEEDEPIEKNYKLSGKYVDEAGVIDMMPLEAIANSSRSLHHYKLERQSYDDLANAVKERLSELGEDLMEGKIKVSPLVKNRIRIGCKFCDYNAICKYDREYSGNKVRILKTKKKEK